MKYICDICGSKETYVKNNRFDFERNGHRIVFNSDSRFCKKCNNMVYDEELDNIATLKGKEIYNKKYGIGEEILNIRKYLGLSQEEFSKIIGCAKKTLISYEKNESIPNDTYLIIIKTILDNPETIKIFIDSNLERYTINELNKINKKLDVVFKTNNPSEFNGYTDISINKIVNLILILSKKAINKTKLLKEMFYVDFLCYKKYAYSLTGLEYYKLPYGPVPDQFEKILGDLYSKSEIKYKKLYKGNYEEHIIENVSKIDSNIFNKDEMKIINEVIEKFSSFKVKDIVNYSHKEKAFTNTQYQDKISYDYAFDLSID